MSKGAAPRLGNPSSGGLLAGKTLTTRRVAGGSAVSDRLCSSPDLCCHRAGSMHFRRCADRVSFSMVSRAPLRGLSLPCLRIQHFAGAKPATDEVGAAREVVVYNHRICCRSLGPMTLLLKWPRSY